MNKIGIIGALLATVSVVGLVWMNYSVVGKTEATTSKTDYKDATYIMDEHEVAFVNGVAEVAAAPGSSAKLTVKYFGNDAEGDLTGDGISDVAFLITQDGGGSGTFFYAVAALQDSTGGYKGTNAIFLGDRIAPQSTQIKDGQIIVNFAERKPQEPFSARPSIGVSRYFKVENERLVSSSEVRH